MSRPSIPKLSLAFKKAATADTAAPLSAQPPEKGPLKVPALGPANGSLSPPMAAIAMPKLNLPARQQLANGASSSSSAAAPPPEQHQPPLDQHQPQQGKGAQEGQHAVYLLVPGLAFPTHSAPGGPPLTVGGLKALCYDNLCPPLPPSSSTSSSSAVSSPPQLEFFRLSALVRLTDDTIPAPPGLVVAGAHLQHQDLTLGLVERLVAENKGLRERMDLAGEALVTLEERAERDAATIRHLREALDTISAQHRALQDKHAAMALLLQPSSPTSSSAAAVASSSSSSTSSTSLAVAPSSGFASLSAPASASVSPRGTSPRPGYHYGIGATSGGVVLPQHPHTLSQTPRSFHNSFPSLTSPRSPSRPTGPFSPRNGEGLVSPATSPRRRLACRTGNCTCNAFTPQPSASWICVCGHMSLKHAGGPP